MPFDLVTLPWQVQLTLASGYAAYALAYVGIRAHHRTIEIAFSTLVFGLAATATFNLLLAYRSGPQAVAMGIAFLLTVYVGLLWRAFGRRLVRASLRLSQISHADDDPSGWTSLFDKTDCDVSQISVRLDDGSWVRCDDTTLFSDAPFGPCVLGANGDLLLYLTHEQSASGDVKELKSVSDKLFGDRLTFVPAGRISLVNIRHKRR